MSTNPRAVSEFTGRHMLMIMVAFFGTIIAVNIGMARLAGSSFGGLVVENSYVASQEFNQKLKQSREQLALRWTGSLEIRNGTIRYMLSDRHGQTVSGTAVRIAFRHPSYEAADWSLSLSQKSDGSYGASHMVRDGTWVTQIDSDTGRAAPFRDVRRITIRNGQIQ